MPIFNQELPKGTKVRLFTVEEALANGVIVEPVLRFSTHDFEHFFYYDENYKNILASRHIHRFLGEVVTVDSGELKPTNLMSDPNAHYYRFRNETGESALMFVCLVKEIVA